MSVEAAPPRVLIMNPFGIGDVLFSTPLIRAVRQAFPRSYLAYLCNRRTEGILRRNPHVDELLVYEKDELLALWRHHWRAGWRALWSLLVTIRRRRFDLAIDLSLGERYSFILALVGVPRRIGFNFRGRGRFLTHRFVMEGYESYHVADYSARLLHMIGIRTLERRLELVPLAEDVEAAKQQLAKLRLSRDGPIVGLAPAGGISWGRQAHFRRWSKEGFIQLGRWLRQRYGAQILVLGEASDRQICADIAQAIGPFACDLSGQTSLGHFVGLVGRCDLVISNDGGPIHIAVSQDVPTVSIFGPVDPTVYGPYPLTDRHRVVYKADLPCRPCYHRFKLPPCPYGQACLSELELSDVAAACEALLENRSVAHQAVARS